MTNAEAIRLYELLRQARRDTTSLSVVAHDVELLRKLARRLDTLAVTWCNTGLTPRQERTRENITSKAIPRILERYHGVSAETGGDPRGYALKLHFDGNAVTGSPTPYNTMGGAEAGYGVAA